MKYVSQATDGDRLANSLSHPRLQTVILAGGSGTRLWPLSRDHHPKQFLDVFCEDRSLLEKTACRLESLATNFEFSDDVIVVCNEAHRFLTAEHLRRSGKPARIILEPAGRNTAPALTVAAHIAQTDGDDPVLVVMPADHLVPDERAFGQAVATAAQYASEGAIVVLSVTPTRADTGYGYIRACGSVGTLGGYKLDKFVEKPTLAAAEQYVRSGEYGWNSGIFVVRASVWERLIRSFKPEIASACDHACAKLECDGPFERLDSEAFLKCESISVDHAVMEKLGTGEEHPAVVVNLPVEWSDIGSWDSLWDASRKDEHGNATQGDVILEDTAHTYVVSSGRLVTCVGLDNVVVVDTPDAVLVADKSRSQNIKAVVSKLKAEARPEAISHRKVERPWGYYDSVDSGDRFHVKRILVNPGAKLSLQMHHHRSEHWIVVRGTAKVTRGGESFLLTENQSSYIPLGVVHRLENPGKTALEIIEVQSGAYLAEDDIVRFDDSYGRR